MDSVGEHAQEEEAGEDPEEAAHLIRQKEDHDKGEHDTKDEYDKWHDYSFENGAPSWDEAPLTDLQALRLNDNAKQNTKQEGHEDKEVPGHMMP